jgi:uncharacterized membrane protein YhaH (DUF805 family)
MLMGFIAAIKSVLSQYAGFSGRARRSEYWWWVLFTLLWSWIPILNLILCLIFFLPSLAVAIRRLHDTGRSGWWILISLIPLIGFIVLLIFYCTDSQIGTNQYGPNPKGNNPQDYQPAAEPAAESAAEPKAATEADRWAD